MRRLLAVHAHPDDETLASGGTLAHYVRDGATSVTLVTCTLGQQGEVIPESLRHLTGEALGAHRRRELERAAAALGVRDHRLLADGRWHDSGMVWVRPGIAGPAPGAGPQAFARADVDVVAAELAAVVRDVRPHVVLTYDPDGGYRHPDHVHTHRVTMRAVDLAAGDSLRPWRVPRVAWVRVPRTWAEQERQAASTDRPRSMLARASADPFPPAVVDDSLIDAVVDVRAVMTAKVAALRAHQTQVRVEGGWFALSDDIAQLVRDREAFQLAPGDEDDASPARPDGVVLTDLFSGVRTDD
ncbi:MAG TPA: N-acetyl-1-D-myo-inositol-2-amino-2-deoxy-alpha-D-glucopyranoside deacetylase [Actinomycetales bacterium]|nr:N-acetyl-1-D-myo-inositol-2-amino-2-deoxy-alpha-D-glucopyranoside deacetylase [Actinomycetales bacterium]